MQTMVGDVRITMIRESVSPTPLEMLFLDADPAVVAGIDWLGSDFVDDAGNLLISIHAFVVESQGKSIVIDTCVGEHQLPGYDLLADVESTFLADLAASGFDPSTVDQVLCTHLHFDHVGWNTRLVDGAWVPTFQNAEYLFGRIEYEHWRSAAGPETFSPTFENSVSPVVEAGLATLVETDHRLTDEVRLVSTPGHTPGHVSVSIESKGARAVITGDVVHHPVQFAQPDWTIMADDDVRAARATRRSFCGDYGDSEVVLYGTHFAGSSCGVLRTEGQAWRFEAAPS